MLMSCKECGGKLSSLAPRCPHCGYVPAAPPPPSPPRNELPQVDLVLPDIRPEDRLRKQAAQAQVSRRDWWYAAALVLGGLIAVLLLWLARRR
jgi:hypothetical protein